LRAHIQVCVCERERETVSACEQESESESARERETKTSGRDIEEAREKLGGSMHESERLRDHDRVLRARLARSHPGVCVRERERKKGAERGRVYVCGRERERVCVCV